jgi:hypothetical protein
MSIAENEKRPAFSVSRRQGLAPQRRRRWPTRQRGSRAKSVERILRQRSPPHLTSRPSPISSLRTTSPSFLFHSLFHATLLRFLLSKNLLHDASKSDIKPSVFEPRTARRKQIFAHPRVFHATPLSWSTLNGTLQIRATGQILAGRVEKRRRAAQGEDGSTDVLRTGVPKPPPACPRSKKFSPAAPSLHCEPVSCQHRPWPYVSVCLAPIPRV